jgi:membrane-associated protein
LIFVATLLGAIFGYWIGVNMEKLHNYSIFRRILNKKHTDKAHKFFEKYGLLAIIFSRFIPIVRTFTPIAAGIAKMKYPLFVNYSFIGSILWSTIVTFTGYFLGHSFPWVIEYIPMFIIAVVLLSILPFIFQIFREKV